MSKSILLVLDLNGLFIERKHSSSHKYDHGYQFRTSNGYYVFVRPYTKEFLKYAFSSFNVGIWSCMNYKNTNNIIKRILTPKQQKHLQFIMTQEDCYNTGEFKQDGSPIFYKSLNKIWKNPELYKFYNHTLLIDDSENKTKYNPEYTSIHPISFNHNYKNDKELKELQTYLLDLNHDETVPVFVKSNPYKERKTSKSDYQNDESNNKINEDGGDHKQLQSKDPFFTYRQNVDINDMDNIVHEQNEMIYKQNHISGYICLTIEVCSHIIKAIVIIGSLKFFYNACSSFGMRV